MQSIFVQIPCYRDFEINKTIASAINNASGEVKIIFGVHLCLLFDSEIEVKTEYSDWAVVRCKKSIAPENIGLQQSRYIANEFYNGEDYYLQIDSHMRFTKNWDLEAISMIKNYLNMGIQKPLITAYPPAYQYDDDNKTEKIDPNVNNVTRILFTENPRQFKKTLIPTQTAHRIPENCFYTASVSGGFIFTFGSFANIKPNPKIAFWGEEPLIAARAFTHGFNLVVPNVSLVWHLYASQQPYSKIRRHHAWRDFEKEWSGMVRFSDIEYRAIFTENIISQYAFGEQRSLQQYEEFSGLNFTTGTISQDGWV